ncbi:MAG: AsmA-like C-terminal domain-containing protein [Syntrophaceae bacterium]
MKTRTRKLLIAAAVILALIGAGLGVYHAYLRPEALRERAQQTLEAKLHRKVVIKSFEIDLLNRPRVTLGQVDFTSAGAVRIQADSLVARFSLWYLLLGRIEIKDVLLLHPLFTIDVERFSQQGQLPDLPTIKTTDGQARLLYKGKVMPVDNINARFGNDRISVKGDIQGGTVALWAMKVAQSWRGGAIVHGMRLDQLYAGLEGNVNMALEFKSEEKGYQFTLIGGAQGLGLPWRAHVRKASFTLSAQGNSQVLDFSKIKLESEIMNLRGTARITGMKEGSEAVLDLSLRSDEFGYDAVVGVLPTKHLPGWLEELLTRQIRGGHSRFTVFNYRGRVSEMGRWDSCLKNMEVVQTLGGQSFAVAGQARVSGVTGTAVLRRGTIDLQGLSGMVNGTRIKMVDIKFPDLPRRGFRVSVAVDLDMPAFDFLTAWRACVAPPKVRAILDPIGKVEGGTVRGAVFVFYENIGHTAVLRGGVTLKDVGLTWDKTPIRRLSGSANAPDFDAPVDLQLACDWDVTAVESLKASLSDPLGRQEFSFVLQARGLPAWESFRLDKDAPFLLSGQGAWPGLQGDLEIRSHEMTLFDQRLSSQDGLMTGKGHLKAQIAPVFTLEIPDLAVGLGTDTLHAKIDSKDAAMVVGVAGTVHLANLKTAGKDTLAPVSGGIDVRLQIDSDKEVRTRGSLSLKQAKFLYKDKPMVFMGLLSFDQDRVATQNLTVRQNRTTADVNGTLRLGKMPFLDADIVVDKLTISASSQGDSSWLKRFTSRSRLTLTNFTYYGIPLARGTAVAEVGPGGLSLKEIDFSGQGGTVKGSTLLSPEGLFSYQLDLDVKDTPMAGFIKAAWPGTAPWMDGVMDLKGRIWGDDKAANGDVVFQARQGRIQRYNLLSKIFSVLNPYKMIKTREIDLSEKGFAYNKIMATFQVRDSVVQFNDFYLDSNSLQISAVGRYLMPSHHLDAVLGIEPLETFDKTINQIPIVGWVLTGEKGSFIVVSLRVSGPVDDVTVKYLPADTIARPVEESLLRILKLPLDLVTKPGEVILPGVLKESGQGKP